MPSTATTRLRFEKQGQGENLNTWGDRLNTVLDLADEAIAGVEPVTVSTANVTLTSTNYVSDQARNACLVLSGTLDANRTVTAPAVEKLYLIVNNCVQGAFSLTIKTASGSGYALRPGPQWVYCDGTDYARAIPRLDQLPLAGASVDLNGQKITSLGTPANGNDAATKTYVDVFTADRSAGGFKLTSLGTPTTGTDAVTKDYADTALVLASQWASLTSGIVAGTDYSAKEFAIGSQASTGGSAKNWAQQSGGVTGSSGGYSAKDWAIKSGSTVDGTYYSARYYALAAATSATNAATSETNAGTSATNAGNSATTAANSAAAALAAVGAVKVTGSDTTAAVLNSKVGVSGIVSKSTTNPGANEVLTLTVTAATAATAATGTATTEAVTPAALKGWTNALSELTAGQIDTAADFIPVYDASGTAMTKVKPANLGVGALNTTEVTGTSQTMTTNNRYIANNASRVALTLPATSAVGDRLEVLGKGAGGWTVAQGAGQSIKYGSNSTSSGTGDGIVSSDTYTSVMLVCTVANTTWTIEAAQGAFTKLGDKGYYAGGSNSSTLNTTVTINFVTAATATLASNLPSTCEAAAGFNSASAGYVTGGSRAGSTSASYTKIPFATEVPANLSATLGAARLYQGGLNSATDGYSVAGMDNANATQQACYKLSFATETSGGISSGSSWPSTTVVPATVCSTTKGYTMGGEYSAGGSWNAIYAILYSTDAVSTLSATLDLGTARCCGGNSGAKGYSFGGLASGGGNRSAIEDLSFSSETSAAISATLSSGRQAQSAPNSSTIAYPGGGYNSGSTTQTVIDGFTFSGETVSASAASLTSARGYSTSFQAGGYL